MRYLRLAVLPLVLAACSETAPVASIDDGPAFNFSNAPAASGIVIRGSSPLGLTWTDPDAGLRVIIGVDMDEYCAGIIDFDVISFQAALLPDGRTAVEVDQGDDLQTTVWDFLAFDCDLFTSVPPLASGVSDLVRTDNDYFGVEPDDPSANAWGWQAHGVLTLVTGGTARFSGHVRNRYNNANGYSGKGKIVLR